jgi:hypothetical protein
VFALVAALARFAPLATLAADTPPTVLTTVDPCVPVTSPASPPVKVIALPAVVAFPTSAPVIVPTMKFPSPSRFTIAFAVFALVAPVPSISNSGG